MFIMRWGLRRIAFSLGAVLIAGGWGATKLVDAHRRPSQVGAWAYITGPLSPSSWLYLGGVTAVTAGAGLMALTVPWRGERLTVAAAGTAAAPAPPAAAPAPPAAAPPLPGTIPPGRPQTPGDSGPKPLQFKRRA